MRYELWDREALDEPGVKMSSDGNRRLTPDAGQHHAARSGPVITNTSRQAQRRTAIAEHWPHGSSPGQRGHFFLLYIRHQALASTFFPGKNVHAPPAGSPALP